MRIKYIINALPIVNKRTQRCTQVDARERRGLSERPGLLELVLELNDRFLKLISYLLGICDRPLLAGYCRSQLSAFGLVNQICILKQDNV